MNPLSKSSLLVVLTLWGAFTSRAFADTNCSTAQGSATYMDRHYGGGPPPPPGFEVGRTEWVFRGTVVERTISCTMEIRNGCSEDEEIHDADLVVRFLPGSEVVLSESPPDRPWEVLRKYVAKMELYRPSGKPLPGGLPRYEEYMICTYRRILAP